MPTICCSGPIPSFADLHANALACMTFPPTGFSVPSLPGLRSPIYSGFSSANLEIVQLVQELQSFQFLTTLSALAAPLAGFLGGAIDDLLPKIPGTGIGLTGLLACDPSGLYAAVQAAITEHGIGAFPFVPTPIFHGISAPALETVNIVKFVLKGFMQSLTDAIFGLINSVTGELGLAAMPALPSFPTLAGIQSMILAQFPGAVSIADVLNKGLSALFAFPVPGFDAIPAFPAPLVPGMSSYAVEFADALNIFLAGLLATPLRLLIDFVSSTLGMLGFSFPAICITF